MNNATLFKYHQDIQSMGQSILAVFHRSKIQQFYKDNGLRLRSLTEKMTALSDEYFQHKDGKVLYDGEQNPLPVEGKDIKEYSDKFEQLMKQEINIIL